MLVVGIDSSSFLHTYRSDDLVANLQGDIHIFEAPPYYPRASTNSLASSVGGALQSWSVSSSGPSQSDSGGTPPLRQHQANGSTIRDSISRRLLSSNPPSSSSHRGLSLASVSSDKGPPSASTMLAAQQSAPVKSDTELPAAVSGCEADRTPSSLPSSEVRDIPPSRSAHCNVAPPASTSSVGEPRPSQTGLEDKASSSMPRASSSVPLATSGSEDKTSPSMPVSTSGSEGKSSSSMPLATSGSVSHGLASMSGCGEQTHSLPGCENTAVSSSSRNRDVSSVSFVDGDRAVDENSDAVKSSDMRDSHRGNEDGRPICSSGSLTGVGGGVITSRAAHSISVSTSLLSPASPLSGSQSGAQLQAMLPVSPNDAVFPSDPCPQRSATPSTGMTPSVSGIALPSDDRETVLLLVLHVQGKAQSGQRWAAIPVCLCVSVSVCLCLSVCLPEQLCCVFCLFFFFVRVSNHQQSVPLACLLLSGSVHPWCCVCIAMRHFSPFRRSSSSGWFALPQSQSHQK